MKAIGVGAHLSLLLTQLLNIDMYPLRIVFLDFHLFYLLDIELFRLKLLLRFLVLLLFLAFGHGRGASTVLLFGLRLVNDFLNLVELSLLPLPLQPFFDDFLVYQRELVLLIVHSLLGIKMFIKRYFLALNDVNNVIRIIVLVIIDFYFLCGLRLTLLFQRGFLLLR